MNRKQRIIVSITGIVLVSLILIGLTYGYYMTKIKGNTKSKSISVVTANLLLEYADVNDELITDSAVEPGKSWTKTFVATNKGNKTLTYGVALENVVNQFERKDDIVYTLDCKQYSKTGFSIDKTNKTVTGTISGTCNGVSDETTFPTIGTILVENDIADDKAQVYTLTITYKEMNVDQSVDMNKTFSAKVNIVDPSQFNPYANVPLKDVIIASAKTATSTSDATRTIYQEIPTTIPGQAISTETEKTLSKTQDDYGDSYYYRGNVVDNFVNYAGMCWRIVRIQGDGSIKLILASELSCSDTNVTTSSGLIKDSDTNDGYLTSYGYENATLGFPMNDYINSSGTTYNARTELNAWLQTKIISDNDKALLKNDDWCIGDRTTAYDSSTHELKTETISQLLKSATTAEAIFRYSAGKRISHDKTPTLKCDGSKEKDGEVDTNKVGMLTVDEAIFAGGDVRSSNSNFYIYKNGIGLGFHVQLLSLYFAGFGDGDYIYTIDHNGEINFNTTNTTMYIRPVISLVSGTEISDGDGTVNNAYVVKTS